MENSVMQLKAFFSTSERPVKTAEMMEFWKSLDEDERTYYKTASIA